MWVTISAGSVGRTRCGRSRSGRKRGGWWWWCGSWWWDTTDAKIKSKRGKVRDRSGWETSRSPWVGSSSNWTNSSNSDTISGSRGVGGGCVETGDDTVGTDNEIIVGGTNTSSCSSGVKVVVVVGVSAGVDRGESNTLSRVLVVARVGVGGGTGSVTDPALATTQTTSGVLLGSDGRKQSGEKESGVLHGCLIVCLLLVLSQLQKL